MKAITNSLWDPWKNQCYYGNVNAHDKAMRLWVLHYVRGEKMIKMEVGKEEPEDNVDNNLTSCKKGKGKILVPVYKLQQLPSVYFWNILKLFIILAWCTWTYWTYGQKTLDKLYDR